jgi:hypothetical protein
MRLSILVLLALITLPLERVTVKIPLTAYLVLMDHGACMELRLHSPALLATLVHKLHLVMLPPSLWHVLLVNFALLEVVAPAPTITTVLLDLLTLRNVLPEQ